MFPIRVFWVMTLVMFDPPPQNRFLDTIQNLAGAKIASQINKAAKKTTRKYLARICKTHISPRPVSERLLGTMSLNFWRMFNDFSWLLHGFTWLHIIVTRFYMILHDFHMMLHDFPLLLLHDFTWFHMRFTRFYTMFHDLYMILHYVT